MLEINETTIDSTTINVPYADWTLLELMGHRRLSGFVKETEIALCKMLRIDVVNSDGSIRLTQFYSPQAIYCMTPISQEKAIALAAISSVAAQLVLPSEVAIPVEVGQGDPSDPFNYEDDYEDEDPHEDCVDYKTEFQ